MEHVFGYTVAHDVSARDWQLHKNHAQWGLSKSMDTFCPLGPSIVHKNSLSGIRKIGKFENRIAIAEIGFRIMVDLDC